ncbi:MAG: hypothetical protein M0Z45_01850 [Actinomycetota bacterium]|nr:hypothetical protein [Actinomycetota bacterium]
MNGGELTSRIKVPEASTFTTFSKEISIPNYVPSSRVTLQIFEKSGTEAFFTGVSHLIYK